MVKKSIKRLGEFFIKPFKEHFLFFIVLCALTVSSHAMGYIAGCAQMNLNATITTAMHCVGLSYVVTLLLGLVRPKILRQILQFVIMVLAALDFAVNFYCSFSLHVPFDSDIALLILGTDPNEAKEFFSTMVPTWLIITVAGIFLFLIFLWRIFTRLKLAPNLGPKASYCALGVVCVCIVANLLNWQVWMTGPIAPFYLLSQHDDPADLKAYFSHPKLIYDETEELPENLVLIIGESFARFHSSIYGYDKLTNPQLADLQKQALLYAFDSIDSPAPTTLYSLRDMMSTYNMSDKQEGKKWYEYITLIEIMKDSGYDCYWFGNQRRISHFNGTTRALAESCDHSWFFNKDNSVEHHYDIVLVDSSYQVVEQIKNKNKNFIIYHMVGSHFEYSLRYPEEFAQFTTKDYPNEPQSHQEVLSTYDNSILYNDYIVRKIMDLYKDSEAIVVYLSDHGQIMYRNPKNPDFYAHATTSDPVEYAYGVEVPFFVYVTPLYQQKHPQVTERIKNRQDNPKKWNSEDLPYFIMDLIGVKTINGEDVRSRSALN